MADQDEQCTCGANCTNLEQIFLQVNCAQCGGGHSVMLGDIDGLIAALEWLRDRRVYAQTTSGQQVSIARVRRPDEATFTSAVGHWRR